MLEPGVLISTFQPSINQSERLPFISTWFVCAGCPERRICSFCGSRLWISVFIYSLIQQPERKQSLLPLIRLSVLVLSSCSADSRTLRMLLAARSPGFPVSSVLSLSEWPAGPMSLCCAVFAPSGEGSLASLALRWEHPSAASAVLILDPPAFSAGSAVPHASRCSSSTQRSVASLLALHK